MEQRWNDIVRKTEALKINISQYYDVHHKFHIVSSTDINITYKKFLIFVSRVRYCLSEWRKLISAVLSSSTLIFVKTMKN
jgi:pyrroloquinoline quinone (PQQ) biosynthesis protein C